MYTNCSTTSSCVLKTEKEVNSQVSHRGKVFECVRRYGGQSISSEISEKMTLHEVKRGICMAALLLSYHTCSFTVQSGAVLQGGGQSSATFHAFVTCSFSPLSESPF